jgi:hypothetical protein
MDFQELSGMTIAQLRGFAEGVEGLTGFTQMRKQQLLEAICQHLNIPMHEHHEAVGINKSAMKKRIRELKRERDAALESHDHVELKRVRKDIHRLKRRIRRALV